MKGREYPVVSLLNNSSVLHELFDSAADEILQADLKHNSRVWPQPIATDIGQLFRGRIAMRNMTTSLRAIPMADLVDSEGEAAILGIPDVWTDLHVWDVFALPRVLSFVVSRVVSKVCVTGYDAIVGVSAIGSILAWTLAYHAGFTGPVLSSYDDPVLVPNPRGSLKGKRVLVVQGRMINGADTEEAISKVVAAGGSCDCVLSMLWMPDESRRDRLGALGRLAQQGVKFLTLARRSCK